jgi:2'-5' RNA ligase
MKLFEIEQDIDHPHGTIAMLKLRESDQQKLYDWCEENNIPCIDKDKLHCTVLFSSTPCAHLTKHHKKSLYVPCTVRGWKKLGDALTLHLDAPRADRIHRYMRSQGGSHDYPDFIPHTTVSYKWKKDELPEVHPNFPLTFDLLEVTAIDPDFGA